MESDVPNTNPSEGRHVRVFRSGAGLVGEEVFGPNDLSGLMDELHDRWCDLSRFAHNPEESTVSWPYWVTPSSRVPRDKVSRRVSSPDGLVTVSNVSSYEIVDTEDIVIYSMNEVTVDGDSLSFTAEPNVIIRLTVNPVAVTIQRTRGGRLLARKEFERVGRTMARASVRMPVSPDAAHSLALEAVKRLWPDREPEVHPETGTIGLATGVDIQDAQAISVIVEPSSEGALITVESAYFHPALFGAWTNRRNVRSVIAELPFTSFEPWRGGRVDR